MLLMDLVPETAFPRATFVVKGSRPAMGDGEFRFDGQVTVELDRSALGSLVLNAMKNRAKRAKDGAITVTFRGTTTFDRPAAAPAGEEEA